MSKTKKIACELSSFSVSFIVCYCAFMNFVMSCVCSIQVAEIISKNNAQYSSRWFPVQLNLTDTTNQPTQIKSTNLVSRYFVIWTLCKKIPKSLNTIYLRDFIGTKIKQYFAYCAVNLRLSLWPLKLQSTWRFAAVVWRHSIIFFIPI